MSRSTISPYLTMDCRSLDSVRNARRKVNVPVHVAGEPNSACCLYEMAHGGLKLLTVDEVNDLNLQSVKAGEGGGCFPATYRKRFGCGLVYEPPPRRIPWTPCLLAAGACFGLMALGWTAEWWVLPILRFLGVM